MMRDSRIDNLAKLLVEYSVAVKRGDLVRISGPPVSEPLIVAIFREVVQAGAHPIVRMTPSCCQEILLKFATEEQLGLVSPVALYEMESIDCDIGVWASENTKALSNTDPARQSLASQAKKALYDICDRREADDSLRWVVTEFPTHAAAQDAEKSLAEYEDFVYQAGKVDQELPVAAWLQLREQQQRICDFMNHASDLHFTTPNGTDLSMNVEDRNWINCHGRRNFPDGEVYTGPHEDSTQGVVYYSFPAVYGGREVEEIRLEFRDGRVVEASATKNEEFLLEMLDQDAGARVLGEIGIGTNYSITSYSKNTLFDEKIGGTFHAAIGASYPKSGGKNESSLHWDMVCDLREGGRIEVDGKSVSENGRFLDGSWPQP